jgi:hypothetical protein
VKQEGIPENGNRNEKSKQIGKDNDSKQEGNTISETIKNTTDDIKNNKSKQERINDKTKQEEITINEKNVSSTVHSKEGEQKQEPIRLYVGDILTCEFKDRRIIDSIEFIHTLTDLIYVTLSKKWQLFLECYLDIMNNFDYETSKRELTDFNHIHQEDSLRDKVHQSCLIVRQKSSSLYIMLIVKVNRLKQ